MDTSIFAVRIEKLIVRRRTRQNLWFYNGSNITNAKKVSSACFKALNQETTASKMSQKGTKWHFNPPSALHHGVSCEYMFGGAKQTFYPILDYRRLTDDVLQTTIYLVEITLNIWLLFSVSNDPSKIDALTKIKFLLGFCFSMVLSYIEIGPINHRRRYVRAQSYADLIWKRWLHQFVPALNCRTKWSTAAADVLKTGGLLWPTEDASHWGHFPLGRIAKFFFGDHHWEKNYVQ